MEKRKLNMIIIVIMIDNSNRNKCIIGTNESLNKQKFK